ncbi:MAG: cell division protein SepF [Clostridiales bacterium]|jgi:cell division inhibitor SepF|nr:cell division protein SepF [Clostridiales bacterium]
MKQGITGIIDSLRRKLLSSDDYYSEEDVEYSEQSEYNDPEAAEGYYEAEREPQRENRYERPEINHIGSNRQKSSSRPSNVIDFKNSYTESRFSVVLTCPTDVPDATYICDYIKSGKACVVNLEGVDRAKAQRIADFLGGSCYSLNGDIERISNEIFIIAPAGVQVTGEMKEELASVGFDFKKVSSFR